MLTQSTAFAPEALWCGERLSESPSSTWSYSSPPIVDCETTHCQDQNCHPSRKQQPLAELPNTSCFDLCFDQPLCSPSEEIFSYKKRPTDQHLNSPQRPFVPVDLDKTIHWDDRALQSLLEAERHNYNQFKNPHRISEMKNNLLYRNEAANWLLDVCTEENCDYNIFPLAITYLNRVLMLTRIPNESLQPIASACLFIASKMKAPQPLTAKRISEYTDGSVSAETILSCEIVVVNLLKWDISLHTVFEFFDQLMVRAPDLEVLRDAFCSIAYRMQLDEELCFLLPSVQCALAICFLMLNTKGWFEYRKLVKFYFGVDFTQLRNYMYRLNPKLTENDLQFMQLVDSRQRLSIYKNANPFIGLI